MFREMRRKNQQLAEEQSVEILEKATSGVLALSGENGYPYAVPLSFVYSNGSLFFHCAAVGNKIDAIKNNNKASFCVIAKDDIVPERYTTHYKSVIAFGNIEILTDEAEKRNALSLVAKKYSPSDEEGREKEIESTIGRVCILKMKVEHLTGKQAKELMQTEEE